MTNSRGQQKLNLKEWLAVGLCLGITRTTNSVCIFYVPILMVSPTWISLFNLHRNSMQQVMLTSTFYRQGNWHRIDFCYF